MTLRRYHSYGGAHSWAGRLLLGWLLSACPAAPRSLDAQQAAGGTAAGDTLIGRVVRDGAGIPEAPVTLHRITSAESGELASTVTDRDGSFRFALEPAPGADFTVYFATTEYMSVRFFGHPTQVDSSAIRDYRIEVYDTASVLPEPIRVSTRDIVLIPGLTGGWEVLEILRVNNPTRFAYVGSGSLPPWEFTLPEGAADFQVGQGQVLPHELNWMGNRVLHITPVIPGSRDILISYRLPRSPNRSALILGQPTDSLNVFVRQPSHLSAISGLQTLRTVESEGESYLLYGAVGLPPDARIEFQWTRPEGPPVDPVVAAVTLTLLLLAIGAYAAVRNRPPAA